MIPALVTTLLWSYCVIAARRSVEQLGENLANMTRLLLAVAVLGAIAHSVGEGIQGSGFLLFFLSGVVGFGVGDIGAFYALPRLGSRLTLLMAQCVAAPVAGITEYLWMGTVISPRQVMAVGVILVGICLALAPSKLPIQGWAMFFAGLFFGSVAALGQGVGAVLSRKAYQVAFADGSWVQAEGVLESLTLGVSAGYQRLLGGIVMVAVFFAISQLYRPWRSLPRESRKGDNLACKIRYVVLNAASGPILGIVCFQWALATTPSGIVQPIVAMTPLVVMPMSYYLEGDRPEPRAVLGALVSVAGVIMLAFFR